MISPPGFMPPPACGPNVDLKVKNVSTVKPFGGGIAGTWGSGLTFYEFSNQGESITASTYGYYARWILYEDDQKQVVENNKWYSCSGWESNYLTCSGPNLDKYDMAEMYIFSENPTCEIPFEVYIFEGENPYPVDEPRTEICVEPRNISLDAVYSGYEDTALWDFHLDFEGYRIEDIAYKYYLTVEGVNFNTGELKSMSSNCFYKNTKMLCNGFNDMKYSNLRYVIYQMPEDVCTQPVASGIRSGVNKEVIISEHQACVPETIKSKLPSFQLKMIGRDPGWNPNFENPFAVHLPSGFSDDDMKSLADHLYVVYDIRNPDGTRWDEDTSDFGCSDPNLYAIPCGYAIYEHGQFVRDDQSVTMQVFYKDYEKDCEELLLEKQWSALQVAQPPLQPPALNRCGLFNDINMSVVYLDWTSGAPLQFYFKMPGGVPGFGKNIAGDKGAWNYSAQIGGYSSSNCNIIQGYEDRLYCTIGLPSGYSSTMRPVTLNVNDCESPIYSVETAFLPEIVGGGGDGGTAGVNSDSGGRETSGGSSGGDPGVEIGGPAGSCSSDLSPTSCAMYSGTYVTPFCATSPCLPSFCACP